MATRKIEVVITGDASSLERALGRASGSSKGLWKSVAGGVVAGSAATAAMRGLTDAVGAGIGEFVQAQQVTAQTNAVIKSTGNVANVSTKGIQNLSESLMKKSGVDDEAIQSGQNMLLTFTKIRNETGKGNKIFDDATKATLNLSVAMGKDMQSSAILVGKALNDPVKGVTALTKAGVQLDASQKNLIKDLVEGRSAVDNIAMSYTGTLSPAQSEQIIKLGKLGMGWREIADEVGIKFTAAQQKSMDFMEEGGHHMEAQKIILKELETQFGGSAEAAGNTFGGQVNIAKESLLNLAGDGVAKAMPALEGLAKWINETGIPAVKRFYGWFQDNVIPVLKELARVAGETWDAIQKKLKEHEPEIKRILGAVESAAKFMGDAFLFFFNNVWLPVMEPLFKTTIPLALGFTITAIDKVISLITWLKEKGGSAITTMWGIIDGPLGKMKDAFNSIKDAIGAVVRGMKWLLDKADDVGNVLGKIPFVPGGSEAGKKSMPSTGFTAPQAGVSSKLWDEIGLGNAMGLRLSSGLRPGDPGDHGRGHAIDMSGSSSAMAAFASNMFGRSGLKDVIYGNLPYWQDNGARVGTWAGNEGLRRDHFDHVHVSAFDDAMRRSRFLMPGLTLAYNGTGRPEPVGIAGMRGATVNVFVSGSVTTERDLVTAVRDGISRIGQRNDGTGL